MQHIDVHRKGSGDVEVLRLVLVRLPITLASSLIQATSLIPLSAVNPVRTSHNEINPVDPVSRVKLAEHASRQIHASEH